MKQFNLATAIALFTLLVSPSAAAADPAETPTPDKPAVEQDAKAPKAAPASPETNTEARRPDAKPAPERAAEPVVDPTAPTDPGSGNAATTLANVEKAQARPVPPSAAELPPRNAVPDRASQARPLTPPAVPASGPIPDPLELPTQAADLKTPNVDPAVQLPTEAVADRALREQIQARLQAKTDLSKGAQLVSVDVQGDTVTLRGSVPTLYEQFAVEQVVWTTSGVKTVRSELRPREAPERPSLTATSLY